MQLGSLMLCRGYSGALVTYSMMGIKGHVFLGHLIILKMNLV